MADSWSINTNDWSFCGDDVLVENPEWVKVYVNKKGCIYFGIKSDGSIEWSVGVPTPIRQYVKDKIAEILNGSDSTSIDGITKIIEFLDGFTTSDTLKILLDNIEERVPDVVNNTEWIKVYVNQAGAIYSGTKADGSNHFFGNVYINNQSLSDVVKNVVSNYLNKELSVSIPSVVYLRTQEEFSIWYRNVIFNSFVFSAGNYSIRCKKKSGNNYSNIGTDSTYEKFNYVSASETEFDLEIRIYDTYTDNIVFSKVVHFMVKNPENIVNKQPKIVLIGDSFTDGHYVCRWTYQFLTDNGFTPQSVGVNRGWPTDGWKDDAWSGKGIEWFHDDATGYLRDDRPLEDAIWDAGWGENEEHGWTSGQTYSDLTAEQKEHGHTKNEFYNPSIKKFDFSYYMSNYHSSIDSIDCVVFNIGLNDVIWNYKTDGELLRLIERLDDMINSVHAFDADANIILCQVTPQPKHDDYTNSTAPDWLTADRAKYWQERWNRMLINHFDTVLYRTSKVFIAPIAANFDANNAIYTKTIHPDKFDDTITQVITSDIHPNEIGAKYISDTIVNTIEGVLF